MFPLLDQDETLDVEISSGSKSVPAAFKSSVEKNLIVGAAIGPLTITFPDTPVEF